MTDARTEIEMARRHLAHNRDADAILCAVEAVILVAEQVMQALPAAAPAVDAPKREWQRHDQVRWLDKGDSDGPHFVAVLQYLDDRHRWHAMVLRSLSANAPMVGSSVMLSEGDPNATVASFRN